MGYIVLDGVKISISNIKQTPIAIAIDDASACAVLHECNTVECVVEVIDCCQVSVFPRHLRFSCCYNDFLPITSRGFTHHRFITRVTGNAARSTSCTWDADGAFVFARTLE